MGPNKTSSSCRDSVQRKVDENQHQFLETEDQQQETDGALAEPDQYDGTQRDRAPSGSEPLGLPANHHSDEREQRKTNCKLCKSSSEPFGCALPRFVGAAKRCTAWYVNGGGVLLFLRPLSISIDLEDF